MSSKMLMQYCNTGFSLLCNRLFTVSPVAAYNYGIVLVEVVLLASMADCREMLSIVGKWERHRPHQCYQAVTNRPL